jgi:hypothetical protein
MKKIYQVQNKKNAGLTLKRALKLKNIKRALAESSRDQANLLKKHGVL